ncbi:hypothetical protein HDU96_007228 [Phlyctochytrium bullatum]|nr:hypothetical protein HDU96_007228 [Phlyctochytrium bullatum]
MATEGSSGFLLSNDDRRTLAANNNQSSPAAMASSNRLAGSRFSFLDLIAFIRRPNTFLGFLELAPGTTALNFSAYLLATFFNICLFVFLNSSQTFVLTQILRVPSENLGDTSGNLTLADEIVSLVCVWLWGLASDFTGRKPVYVTAYTVMAVALAFYTFTANVYPQLLLLRLVFAVGGAAASSMLTAVLADYASDKDRGKSSGLVGLMSGLGALLALFVFLRLPANYDDVVKGLRTVYLMVAGISVLFAVFLLFALKAKEINRHHPFPSSSVDSNSRDPLAAAPADGPSSSSSVSVDSNGSGSSPKVSAESGAQTTERRGLGSGFQSEWSVKRIWENALDGVKAAKDVKILLGYIGASLARGDTVIITIFLPLWVYKSYIDSGLCEAPSPDAPDIKDICRPAYIRASILSGVAQTFALVGAPFFGWLGDRFYSPFSTIVAGALGIFSYGLMFVVNPLSGSIWIAVCLVGLAEIGMVISNLQLVTSHASIPAHMRGSVAGISSACGAIGILITSKLGGWLFDRWQKGAPFLLLAIGHTLAFVKGLQYVEVELHANEDGTEKKCSAPFSLLFPHECDTGADEDTVMTDAKDEKVAGKKSKREDGGNHGTNKREKKDAKKAGAAEREKRARKESTTVETPLAAKQIANGTPLNTNPDNADNTSAAKAPGTSDNSSAINNTKSPIPISRNEVTILEGHESEVFVCAWNPRYMVIASG